MSLQEVVVEGTLKPDGALELDEKPNLTPGRVTVILRPVPTLAEGDPFWRRMQAIWDAQKAAGLPPRTTEQTVTEGREEWDERQRAIERLQDECRTARQSPGGTESVTVYLDANCVIYFVERHPVRWPKVVARVTALRTAGAELAVGDLTVAECLVGPFKHGDSVAEASYRTFFADPDIRVLPITSASCERAARIRAAYNLKLPDALHLGTAVEHGCGLFLTNDATLTRCTDITVEVLP